MNWQKLKCRAWALAGNSRTVLVAYGMEVAGYIDEAKYFDWSNIVGSERAGRIVAACGVIMIVLRVMTKAAVLFSPQTTSEPPNAR